MPLFAAKAEELFQGTGPRESDLLSRLCAERRYAEGATIFSRGDPAETLYLLKEGLVRLCSVSEKGTESILHILKPDAIFGELLFSEEERALTAVAQTDLLVTTLSRTNLQDLLLAVPVVSRNFIRLLSRRLAKVEREFVDFGHTWSYHRLAYVLLKLADEHGVETGTGTKITVRLTHEDLAKLIGTTRETVTTQLGRFRKLGMVRRDGRHLVLEREKLTRFARSA